MAEISAALVKELRDRTGLPMMDCKKALTETNGDIDKAEELLRIKSGAKASKAASRVAAEGVIGSFVAADAKLVLAFARSIAEVVATRDPGAAEEDKRQKLVQKIGENITIRRFKRLQAKGRLALYIHAGAKIGVLVDYEGAEDVGKDVAMHIAFARPKHLAKSEVPQDVVAQERKIQEARARESGKPPEIVAKMVEGSLNKFLGEISLMGQPFIKDDKQTIEKMLATKRAKVNGYAFLVVGEGIEKAQPAH